MIPLFAQTDIGVLNDNPTIEEFESQVYCDGCFNTIEAYERKQANLKAEVMQKGVTNAKLIDNFLDLEKMYEYWKEKANEKPTMRDVGFFPKLWLFFKGVLVGVVAGFVLLSVI